jgi:hypothetical protein
LFLGVGAARANPPAEGTTTEYKVKAVFLFNFAQFVDWPPTAFTNRQAPLVIGVLGEDPFGAYLDDVVRGEQVEGRRIVVCRYRTVAEIDACHILFVSKSEAPRLSGVLDALKLRPVLTVSDLDRFAERGGIVRFVTEQGKIRLGVNADAAKRARLIISSKILRAATLVADGHE